MSEQTAVIPQLNENEILRVENLSMRFGGLKAVDQLSFSINEH